MLPLIPECNVGYSMGDDEDKESYGAGWQLLNGINARAEYFYITSDDLKTFPYIGNNAVYGGGGYVVELKGDVPTMLRKINRLRSEGWIDRYTRAVFIDFTVYNAQVNLFVVCTYLAEFLTSNVIDPYYVLTPMNLLGYGTFYVAFQFIFVAMVVFLLVKECRSVYKMKRRYFMRFWTIIDLLVLVFCIALIAVYTIRSVETAKLTNIFAESGGEGYMNFQVVAYWNQIVDYMVGFTEFLATIKFIRLLRFNSYMNLLALTLQYDSASLISFMVVFFVIFGAFVAFFYLIYNCYLFVFLTFLNSMMTSFQMLVGKFNYPEMQKVNPVVGPLIFFCYNCIVLFLLISMFQTILNKSFEFVRQHVDEVSDDKAMMDYMMERFLKATGVGDLLDRMGLTKKEAADKNAQENTETSTDINTLERLPDVIDRLMDMLSSISSANKTWDSNYLIPMLLQKGNTKDVALILQETNKNTKVQKLERRSTKVPISLPDVEETSKVNLESEC